MDLIGALSSISAIVTEEDIGWNLSTANYDSSMSPIAQEDNISAIEFKPDGTKMYFVGTTGDDVNEYDLSTAWDLSTASYSQSFSISSEETSPQGIRFKPDGTKMYVVGGSRNVREYDLSTAWNISTASYSQAVAIGGFEFNPQGLYFRSDGVKMYIVGASGDEVNEFTLSTAWDVTTASHVQLFSVASQDTTPTCIFFKPDGKKMYVSGLAGDDINQYDLSTAWDISTASYVQNFSVITQLENPNGLYFKSDGTLMFVSSASSDLIALYTLTA